MHLDGTARKRCSQLNFARFRDIYLFYISIFHVCESQKEFRSEEAVSSVQSKDRLLKM